MNKDSPDDLVADVTDEEEAAVELVDGGHISGHDFEAEEEDILTQQMPLTRQPIRQSKTFQLLQRH